MKITRAFLDRGKSAAGGLSRLQTDLLGVPYPLKTGWKKRLIGNEISEEKAREFLELKDAHLPAGRIERLKKAGTITDTDRMDWLVRMAVEVRIPLVYGSREFFHAEEVSDEHEDYRNNLREQIDAAMSPKTK